MVHNRDSNEEMLGVVREEAFRGLQADFHSFAGGLDMARELIERGFYLGLSGMITFPKADNVREVLPILPPDRCLVETDTPYLAADSVPGKAQPAGLCGRDRGAAGEGDEGDAGGGGAAHRRQLLPSFQEGGELIKPDWGCR